MPYGYAPKEVPLGGALRGLAVGNFKKVSEVNAYVKPDPVVINARRQPTPPSKLAHSLCANAKSMAAHTAATCAALHCSAVARGLSG